MKLRECLELGRKCGLTDVGEAYLNVEMHMTMLFDYDCMADEMNELTLEYNDLYNNKILDANTTIEDALKLELK